MTLDEAKIVLKKLEGELAAANTHKLKLAFDVRVASAAAGICIIGERNRHAHAMSSTLDMADEAGHLVLALEKRVDEARRRVAMAVAYEASIASKAAASDPAPRDKCFEVRVPGRMARVVRHWASSREALEAQLEPGYLVTHRVFGASPDGSGGMTEAACRAVSEFMRENV